MAQLEDVINRINESNSINIFYNMRDPSSFATASALYELKFKNKIINIESLNRSGISTEKKFMLPDYCDLILFIGLHGIPSGILKRNDVLKLDDSLSLPNLKYSNVYIVNKNNYAGSETTSYAEVAYRILQENDIETDKFLDLLLMLGDRDDNPELGMTKFQKEVGEKNEFPLDINLTNPLEEYKIFGYLPFSTFYDYLSHVNFKYSYSKEDDEYYLKNRVNVSEFINEFNLNSKNLSNKLYDMFKEQEILNRIKKSVNSEFTIDDLLYSYSFNSHAIDELLLGLSNFLRYVKEVNNRNLLKEPKKNYFWEKNLDYFIFDSAEYIKKVIRDEISTYSNKKIKINSIKKDNFELFYINNQGDHAGNFGGKWTWFPFFNWGSLILEYNYNEARDISHAMFYSKSDTHAGVISSIYSRELRSQNGSGGGESFKALISSKGKLEDINIKGKNYQKIMLHVLKDITRAKLYVPSLDHFLLYHSIVDGTPAVLILNGGGHKNKSYNLYPPYKYIKSEKEFGSFVAFKEEHPDAIIVDYPVLKG